MTGIIVTISLLAAFQGDAALPTASSAMYLSGMHRSVSGIERLRAFLPGIPDRPAARVRIAGMPLHACAMPELYRTVCDSVLPAYATAAQDACLETAPIRGPDSILIA